MNILGRHLYVAWQGKDVGNFCVKMHVCVCVCVILVRYVLT